MDVNEEIRFRVVNETFVDLTPTGPDMSSGDKKKAEEQETKKSPYTVTVSARWMACIQMWWHTRTSLVYRKLFAIQLWGSLKRMCLGRSIARTLIMLSWDLWNSILHKAMLVKWVDLCRMLSNVQLGIFICTWPQLNNIAFWLYANNFKNLYCHCACLWVRCFFFNFDFLLQGSISEPGLGLLSWWNNT